MARSKAGGRWLLGIPVVLGAAAAAVLAAAGSLDTSFGTGGAVVIPSLVPGTAITSVAWAAVVQADGKVVVGGLDQGGGTFQWRIRRLLADGTADAGFGSGGVVTLFGGSVSSRLYGLALDSSGRVLAAGDRGGATVVRLNLDGSLDTSFGSGGIVTLLVPGTYQGITQGRAVALQPDGKILLAGAAALPVKKTYQYARLIARLGTNGVLDPTFGAGGIRIQDITKGDDWAQSIALQSDGRIVLGGMVGDTQTSALSRLSAAGASDAAFGAQVTPFIANALVVDGADRILVSGTRNTGATSCGAAVARYSANGVLDASFGTGGTATVSDPTIEKTYGVGHLAVRSDGRILVGTMVTASASQNLARPIRLSAAGQLDSTFGTAGFGDAFSGYVASPRDLALAPDGGFFLVGQVAQEGVPFSLSWFVARYLGN